ncbi:FecR domain-containing protein [Winogradskyella sp. SYSU M77433]|uniref:FecR domain-containing protein n=1 Tax=Winogradskyella sp. SYSU M77433 TaxID=3042722 RepID=UPI002480F82D|nr:FecR domain-containing protein [Winogradskyella sp. SYSU M77433]MDH7912869.1 TonB-dependent receptor plug domain-containing protein [Winogradskyella sp. SYSU M77433]
MRLIYVFVLMLQPILAFSQEEAFYLEFKDESLVKVFSEIENTYDVLFSYKDIDVDKKQISIVGKKRTLKEILELIKQKTNLNFNVLSNRYVVVLKSSEEIMTSVRELDMVVIKSYLTSGIEKNKDGSFKLVPSELGILPGLTEPDVLESIQLLPGVLSPNETASGFFVRGGSSDQNRLIWDGINIYHKGHLFGMISPLDPNVASKINFINKGSHSRYGERLSSVIEIFSNESIDNTLNVELGANGTNVDALLELPILKDKLSLQASVRRSYMELFETPTYNQLAEKVFESTKISEGDSGENDFSFMDYTLRLNYKPNRSNSFYVSLINIDNQLDYNSEETTSNRMFNDNLVITNSGYSAGWDIKWNDKLSQKSQAFFSDYSLNYNFITKENNEQVSDFEKRNTIYDSGISTELNYRKSDVLIYNFGYQYNLKDVAYAFINTADLSFVLDTEERIIQTHSLYGNVDYKSKTSFNFSLGLRGSYYKEIDAVRLEPRLIIHKDISDYLKLQATTEIKNQIINEVDETVFSDLSLENKVWRLIDGNDFPILNSHHTSLGFIYTKGSFSVDTDVYYKTLKNVSALSLGFLNPENSEFNVGNQNVLGLDVFLKKRFNGFNTWVSYSFNRARSKFKNLNENKSFNSKSNVTHAISTAVSYKKDGFQASLGWKWQTGRPYTIAEESDDGLDFNNGINTGKLPVYHRLDLSSTYSFNFSKKSNLKGKVGVSLRNIYNRHNLITKEYRGNNSLSDSVELIECYSIGITPNIMFRLYW